MNFIKQLKNFIFVIYTKFSTYPYIKYKKYTEYFII